MNCRLLLLGLLLASGLYAEAPADADTATEIAAPAGTPEAAPGKEVKKPETPDAEESNIIYLDPQKTVRIDKKNKTVSIPAEVCITRAPIELALGSTYSPNCRAHESIFLTKIQPELIHAALISIELEPGKGVDTNGQDRMPTGAGLYIYVEWDKNIPVGQDPVKAEKEDSLEAAIAALDAEEEPAAEKKLKPAEKAEKVRVRLEDLIFNVRVDEPLSDLKWIFTGSRTVKTRNGLKYDADLEGTVIATWHCSSTVIDIPLPEGSDDEAFRAYKQKLPPTKTPVTFIFSADELKSEPPGPGVTDQKTAPKAANPGTETPEVPGGDRDHKDTPED